MRAVLLVVLVLVTAACTSGSEDNADMLSVLIEPSTTFASSTTLTPPTTALTTSTTTTVASSTTTLVRPTEVLGTGENEASNLQELPLTGGNPELALIAFFLLAVGAWLVRKANVAQWILEQIRSNLSR